MTEDITKTRKTLELGGTLRWFHWLIVFASLLLTIGAWYFSKTQFEAKIELQFDREADQVVDLIVDRMKKYEDALWSGVALTQTTGGDVTHQQWETFATSLRIEEKYPGINGIGVVHRIKSDQLDRYIRYQRAIRSDFGIHPPHHETEYWPITYVIPVGPNAKAVGLDMAHETNRYTAGKKARDTGLAQITGPITLVQDAARTPGFLFYAPFYVGGRYASIEARQDRFVGMVYAPFIVKKLMEGVLDQHKRHVGLRIVDQGDMLYDEHDPDNEDFDAHPLFQKEVTIPLYGRDWNFDIRSTQAFRLATSNNQPVIILVAGIIIDSLLLSVFILLSYGSRKAMAYVDIAKRELQLILDSAGEGIYGIDIEGNTTFVNPAAADLLGYEQAELLGKPMHLTIHHSRSDGSPYPREACPMYKAFRDGQTHRIDNEVLWRKDGTSFPIEYTSTPIRDEHGALTGAVVTFQDTTERKEADQKVVEGNHRLQAVMDTAVDGIITIDARGIMLDCNPAASRIFGYQPEEMVGQNVKMLMPAPYHEEHDGYLERYQETGVPHIIGIGARDLIGKRKDGSTFPMDLSVGKMECNGEIFYSGLVRDITERKEGEEALKTALEEQVEATQQLADGQQRLRAVMDTAVDGIITIDARGTMQDCNPAASRIFGYLPEEMVGQNVKMLMPAPYHEEHDGYLERYQETGVPHIIGIGARDLIGKRKDGSTFPMDLSVGEMECDGQTFYSGLVRDITERKEGDEALRATNEELERFAYIASHDLKAPLRVIDNASKWLEEDLAEHLTGDNRDNMNLMRSRVARMEKLLDDLLEYSRVGRATDDRYQERVNGATLVAEIMELLAPPEEFTIEVSAAFASIHVLKMPLQQILLNLVNNALKHHDKPQGVIQVGVEDRAGHYRFTVSDDGPGIPHAFHEQVFDMFQTLKPRDQVEGSGMGLALVKKHVELVGGTVHLDSIDGEGSTFTIHWPKQYAMEEQPA